jgi:hypothetical protein
MSPASGAGERLVPRWLFLVPIRIRGLVAKESRMVRASPGAACLSSAQVMSCITGAQRASLATMHSVCTAHEWPVVNVRTDQEGFVKTYRP